MPPEHDLDPDAMTEEERRAKNRFDAYFAFETQPRTAWFDQGTEEGRSSHRREDAKSQSS